MMMAEAPPVVAAAAAAADHHLSFGRNNETAALLLLGAGAGAVVELGDPPPPSDTVCSKACTNGKKGTVSRLSGRLLIMVFSPHSTFRPVSKLIASERERVTTRSECVCMLLL